MPRPLHNTLIVVLLALIVADASPDWLPGVKPAGDAAHRILRPFGLWQGNWKLFAPNPDHMNAWVEARITWSDDTVTTWTTPDWRERGAWERLASGRWQKLADTFRRDDAGTHHSALVDWLLRVTPAPSEGAEPVRVELVRHWWNAAGPRRWDSALERFGTLPPPREDYPNEKVFVARELQR